MCFFNCVLVLHSCCYCAFFLKLHPIWFSYAPYLLLFGGDFPFIFYDNEEVIISHEFMFFSVFFILGLLLGWSVTFKVDL